jgi:hypothetical protein
VRRNSPLFFSNRFLRAIRTKPVYGNARQRYGVNKRRKTATNAFVKSNNINILGFKHLVDIEGVTGSIPVAPTIQSH